MQDNTPLTIGVDHVGLAVKNLESARRFFCECLGWKLVGESQTYPASFVSDGSGIVTLWQVEDPEKCVLFDRRRNVGLHHLALKIVDRDALDALHARVAA
jgi:catechol 2,3-dioxygenase-like lactoylglutathione lyase family enzyme